MTAIVNIGVHRSLGFEAAMSDLLGALREKRLPASFLYRGARSAALWERLHLAHAPSTQSAVTSAPHREAFKYLRSRINQPVHLVAAGCGLAEKEMILLEIDEGCVGKLDLIDGSVELVAEAKRRILERHGKLGVRGLAADLGIERDWNALFSSASAETRVLTLFGMVPNFELSKLLPSLSDALRPGDWLVLDANLRPGKGGAEGEIPEGIMAQYDNAECRDWLQSSLSELGIFETDGRLIYEVARDSGDVEVPRIQAMFQFSQDVCVSLVGPTIRFDAGDRLSVFYSYRYTAQDMPQMLQEAAFECEKLCFSETGEDGVYVLRKK